MKNILKPTILLTFLVLGISLLAGDYVSLKDGEFHDPTSWNCSCVPGLLDNITVSHKITGNVNVFVNDVYVPSGGKLYMQLNTIVILGDLVVDTGGEIRNFRNMDVFGNYHLDGVHSGSSTTRIRGADNIIDGTGTIANPGNFDFKDGDKIIAPTAFITKNTGVLQILNAVTVENYGHIIAKDFAGGAFRTWINKTGSILEIKGIVSSDFNLLASDSNNVVKYIKIGATNQNIAVPVNGNYYNLMISGNNIGGTKYLTGDINVLGDLTIKQNILQTDNPDGNHNITLFGNWINNTGQFEANNNTVYFAGTNQVITQGGGLESFHNIEISDTTLVSSNVDLYCTGSITNYGTLELLNKEVYLVGDWNNQGSADLTGTTIELTGTDKQYLSGNTEFDFLKMSNTDTVYIQTGLMTINTEFLSNSGNFFTNDSLLIKSNAAGTGRIGRTTGNVWGDVTVQRYMNPTALSWHTLGSPVIGSTLQSWNDDFITSGFPGSNYPSFPYVNIQFYDETQVGWKDIGLMPPTNITNPVPIGQGIRAYIAAGPKVMDVAGPIHTGPFTFGVTYTNTSSPLDDGWVLLCNPYASTIDWDDGSGWTRFGLNDAIYVWNSDLQQYTSYISGVGTNGGSPYIPHSQAFWVQTNHVAANLRVNENAKTIVPGVYRNDENINPEYFKLKIGDELNRVDESIVRLNKNASPEFDPSFDAYKFYSMNDMVPSISTLTQEGIDLSINTIPYITSEESMFVKLRVSSDGTYNISALGLDNFVGSACLVLEDLENNTITNLKNDVLEVDLLAGEYSERFVLHMSKPIDVEVVDLLCADTPEGKILVKGFGSIPWDVKVFNEDNMMVFGGNIYSATWIENLAEGVYTVEIANSGGSYCSEASRKAVVNGPEILDFESIVSHVTCGESPNGSIKFEIRGGVAPYTIEVNGEDVEGNLTGLSAGAYQVNITDVNGCTISKLIRIATMENLEADFKTDVYSNQGGGGIVKFKNLSTSYADMYWDFGDGSTSNAINPTHSYFSSGSYTVTLTASTENCEKMISHQIEIATSDNKPGSTRTLVSKRNDQIQVTLFDSDNGLHWLTGYNAVGQVVIERQMLNPDESQHMISVGDFGGLMIVVIENPELGNQIARKIVF